MTVVVIKLNPFSTVQLNNVSSISYADNTYTVVAGGVTYTYAKADYKINILW